MANITGTAQERKDQPIYSGVVKYFPRALAAIAHLSKVGNDQHNPGMPLHWDRSKSGDELDALMRHLTDAGTRDTDGEWHDTKVAWRALANLEKLLEKHALLAEELEAHAWLEEALDYEDGWPVIEGAPVRKNPQSANPAAAGAFLQSPGPETPGETNGALEALPKAEEPCSELVDLVGTEEMPEYEAEPDAPVMVRRTSADKPRYTPLTARDYSRIEASVQKYGR